MDTLQNTGSLLPANVLNLAFPLVGAIAIFLVGWVVATIAANLTGKLLKRSQVDARLANAIGGGPPSLNLRRIAKTVVFWLILLLAIVAALNVLNLTVVATPLNAFLSQIFEYLPRLGSAALLLFIAWAVATIAKLVVTRTANSFGLDEKLNALEDTEDASQASEQQRPWQMSTTIGYVVYGLIFLFFLPLILGVLELQGPLAPVQNLLNQFLAALPSLFKAGTIGIIGWFIARILRDIVTNVLIGTGVNNFGPRLGIGANSTMPSLARLGGMVVYGLVLIITAIAVFEALALPAISTPAVAMLNQVLSAIPLIVTAVAILGISYVLGKFAAEFITSFLEGIGFNNLFQVIGVDPAIARGNSPSQIVGVIVHIGIMLFATVAATNVLNIPALTTIVAGIMVILGQVLVGLVIFAIGLYLANLVNRLISSSGTAQAQLLGQAARIAILVLVSAMALQQMGIATTIVNLAFGFLLGTIAVATAIAFGLGGRDVAAKHLDQWLNSFNALRNGHNVNREVNRDAQAVSPPPQIPQ